MARHPGPADLALVVEVSNTTLATDRGPKLAAYARAGISAYWIINLDDLQLEVFSEPEAQSSSYRKRSVVRAGESISLLPGAGSTPTIPVADLLPP